jgi:hypothetical protein
MALIGSHGHQWSGCFSCAAIIQAAAFAQSRKHSKAPREPGAIQPASKLAPLLGAGKEFNVRFLVQTFPPSFAMRTRAGKPLSCPGRGYPRSSVDDEKGANSVTPAAGIDCKNSLQKAHFPQGGNSVAYSVDPRVLERVSGPVYDPIRLAAILIDRPRIAALKMKPRIDCASTVLRIARVITTTSEVWAATAIVNEKYRKSQ